MGDVLKIKLIKKEGQSITYFYECSGLWRKFLNTDTNFFICYDQIVEKVSDSIAVIPFLSNILPISWIYNLSIEVEELDKNFYECLTNVKMGYQSLYPDLKFSGQLRVSRIVTNEFSRQKSAVLFSGGVDAFCTLFRHLDENPELITFFGADVALNDKEGIDMVNNLHNDIANDFKLRYRPVYSNFKEMLNYNSLKFNSILDTKYEWWHDFQHGITFLSLVAPLAYLNGYSMVYIASSFCYTQKGNYTCASDPLIDNNVKYGCTNIFHDSYDLNRQQKIQLICNEKRNRNVDNIKLRVCWHTTGGINCCNCEKCYRTMLGIIASKEDPKNFYFNYSVENRKNMMKFLSKHLKYNDHNHVINNYTPIQKSFLDNYSFDETPQDLIWFRTIKIGKKSLKFYYLCKHLKEKMVKFIKNK